ncbi:hypothetical protein F1640_13220 [Novosphingobium sp. NBM11]|uniref:hypothetical protein n=1 Tax=unclassified Novosphingobium TaxID=2644732 RepID=UPI00061BCA4E|nr:MULTISPECIES: hypothetical protein [unclassified Novosphingobium]MBF5090962.1 hypothetical protein [Novosphingobium sp. NBM11]GAO54995.1 hypothetical protein NMD1_02098 [Novosphingobium sp. MD-1]
MIDKITVLVPHFLMALMIWRLLHRPDLDRDPLVEGKGGSPDAQDRKPGRWRQTVSTPDSKP